MRVLSGLASGHKRRRFRRPGKSLHDHIKFNIQAHGVELDDDTLTQEWQVSLFDSEILYLVRLHKPGPLSVRGDESFKLFLIADIGRAVQAPVQSDAAVGDGELEADGVAGTGGGRWLKCEDDEAAVVSFLSEVFKQNWDLLQRAFTECRGRLAFVWFAFDSELFQTLGALGNEGSIDDRHTFATARRSRGFSRTYPNDERRDNPEYCASHGGPEKYGHK